MHTAKHIVRNSAENLSQVSLELGGKSPVVVFSDARKDNAINGILASIFGASGQSCIAGSRLYLQESIYNEYVEEIKKRAESIKIGDPMNDQTQMGPLATLQQLNNIQEKLEKALQQGGKLVTGG